MKIFFVKHKKIISIVGIIVLLLSVAFYNHTLNSYAFLTDVEAIEHRLPDSWYKDTVFKYETKDGEFIIFIDDDGRSSNAILKKKTIYGTERYRFRSATTGLFYSKGLQSASRNLKFYIANRESWAEDVDFGGYTPIVQEIKLYDGSGYPYRVIVYIVDKTEEGTMYLNENNVIHPGDAYKTF